jgi:F0F1-type ATP synthase assembly protein I
VNKKQKPLNLELGRYTPKWAKRLVARRALVVAMYAIPAAALLLRATLATGWLSSLAGWMAVLVPVLC